MEIENNQDKDLSSAKPAEEKRDEILNRIAMASIVEQRKTRRWSAFWKALTFVYLGVILFAVIGAMNAGKDLSESNLASGSKSGKHTAVVNLKGVIADGTQANADMVIRGLQKAFKNKNTAGVILRINSPGGSPVQSAQIYDEMRRLRGLHPEKPLYVVIDDIGASGGYYIAAGAEKIFANKSSLVGSIGVIMGNFGFVDAMKKLGVERRVLTAGKNKALADPFSPQDPQTTAHLKSMLNEVHLQFIDAVKAGRGDRLIQNDDIFSGLIWTAEKGMELGLIDGIGDVRSVARDEIGEETLLNFTAKPDFFENFANQLGASVSASFLNLLANPTIQ